MSDENQTPDEALLPNPEIRLSSGQRAQMQDGGTLRVIAHKELPPHHFRMSVAQRDEHEKATTEVRSATYDSLVEFLKQLEKLDYLLLNIERVDGLFPNMR